MYLCSNKSYELINKVIKGKGQGVSYYTYIDGNVCMYVCKELAD